MEGLNYLQTYAYSVLMAGYSVFLTGDAGTGKTYTINKFVKDQRYRGRNVMVCAPTGIAALHVNGVTLHHQFKASVTPNIKRAVDQEALYKLVDTDTLIIEEVSMCRIDLFDFIMMYLFNANSIRKKMNRPNIQLVLCGDFLQLPPVITDKDREVLEKFYNRNIGAGFAFESEYWKLLDLHVIVLIEVVRQGNTEFIKILNKLRVGNKSAVQYIMDNCSKAPIPDAINLYGKNNTATERNIEELNKLPTELYIHDAIVTGAAKITDTNADEKLALKVGARVMSLVNNELQNGDLLYGNGSLGTVVSINEDSVTVEFDDGFIYNVEMYEWKVKQYDIDEASKKNGNPVLVERDIGSVWQYPLKLAYAVTIHKSQGQTFNAVNINPYAWDCGQLYVALSRVKDVNNLYLTNEINPEYLVVSLNVISFYNSIVKEANRTLDLTVDLTAPKQVSFENNELNKVLNIFDNIGK
jgi:hypothetical protein